MVYPFWYMHLTGERPQSKFRLSLDGYFLFLVILKTWFDLQSTGCVSDLTRWWFNSPSVLCLCAGSQRYYSSQTQPRCPLTFCHTTEYKGAKLRGYTKQAGLWQPMPPPTCWCLRMPSVCLMVLQGQWSKSREHSSPFPHWSHPSSPSGGIPELR